MGSGEHLITIKRALHEVYETIKVKHADGGMYSVNHASQYDFYYDYTDEGEEALKDDLKALEKAIDYVTARIEAI